MKLLCNFCLLFLLKEAMLLWHLKELCSLQISLISSFYLACINPKRTEVYTNPFYVIMFNPPGKPVLDF
jgi:hypothetical protein